MPDDDLKGGDKKFSTSVGPEDTSKTSDKGGPIPVIDSGNQFGTGWDSGIGQDGPDAGSGSVGTVDSRGYSDEPKSPPSPRRTKDGVNQSLNASPRSGT